MRNTCGSVITILITKLGNNFSGVTPKTGINSDRQTNSTITKAKKLNKLAIRDKLKSPLPSHVKAINNKTINKIV